MGYGGPTPPSWPPANSTTADARSHHRRKPGPPRQYAMRMALQTREQHIRREKATSNICTAQALLANMAAMYAVYHGAEGLIAIAKRTHHFAVILADTLKRRGIPWPRTPSSIPSRSTWPRKARRNPATGGTERLQLFLSRYGGHPDQLRRDGGYYRPRGLLPHLRGTAELPGCRTRRGWRGKWYRSPYCSGAPAQKRFLTHPNFRNYRPETEMMRYLKRLENKDLRLVHSMIPLGSCTMKLNAATELIPVSWPSSPISTPSRRSSRPQGTARSSANWSTTWRRSPASPPAACSPIAVPAGNTPD